MNLTYDYSLISVANKVAVRERAREFKKRFTDGDLMRAMVEAFGRNNGLHGYEDIISCDVDVYEYDCTSNGYSVHMCLHSYKIMYRVSFICNDDLEIHMTDSTFYAVERYKLVEEEN